MSAKAITSSLTALRLPLGTALISKTVEPAVAKTLALPGSLKISMTSFNILAIFNTSYYENLVGQITFFCSASQGDYSWKIVVVEMILYILWGYFHEVGSFRI
jgi:hypothetical protein